jgi:hypothetical protein
MHRCQPIPNKPKITIATIAVLHITDKGKKAAKESLTMMVKYFGGNPKLTLFTMGNAKGIPFYVFIINGIEPRLPRLPGSKPNTPTKRNHMNF